jgi:hypothetical protein
MGAAELAHILRSLKRAKERLLRDGGELLGVGRDHGGDGQ